MELGYALSSEEHSPRDLVANARAAEAAGFGFGHGADIGLGDLFANLGIAVLGNLVGGILFVTLVRSAQVAAGGKPSD